MIIRTCAFTDKGKSLCKELIEKADDLLFEIKTEEESTKDFVAKSFEMKAPIVFIGATGIAVRFIASYVSDKLSDSPVIVIDENAKFVIPILSGHVGRANELATKLSKRLNATAVITTATDVEETFSVDVFAVKNGLEILNREGIRKVSSKLLNEGRIKIAINPKISYDGQGDKSSESKNHENGLNSNASTKDSFGSKGFELIPWEAKENSNILIDLYENRDTYDKDSIKEDKIILLFKPYVLGIGCKKDTDYKKLDEFIEDILKDKGIDYSQIAFIASIDLKSKEYALNYIEGYRKLPFITYSANELESVKGDFTESDFVKSVTGVSNVCERAAMKTAGEGGLLHTKKTAQDGMTIAIAIRDKRITTWET